MKNEKIKSVMTGVFIMIAMISASMMDSEDITIPAVLLLISSLWFMVMGREKRAR